MPALKSDLDIMQLLSQQTFLDDSICHTLTKMMDQCELEDENLKTHFPTVTEKTYSSFFLIIDYMDIRNFFC